MMAPPPPQEWTPGVGPRAPVPEPVIEPEEPKVLRANWFGGHDWMRRHREPTPPWTPGKVSAAIVLWLAIGLLAFSVVLSVVLFFQDDGDVAPVGSEEILFGAGLNLLWFVVPPFVYVAAFHGGGWNALRHRLLLRSDHVPRDIGLGIGGAVVFVILGVVLILLLEQVGVPTENPVVEALGPELSWPLIVLVAASSGISEEVFFRGFLQGRWGIVPANIAFGLAHADYGTPLQIILPMGLGFLFSWMMLRTRSLWPPIIAHAGFNLIMLSLTKVSSDQGWTALLPAL